MEFPIINSREDLDALAGTVVHEAFMASLAGTLWRLERDDAAQTWRVVECNWGIERFGFSRSDFPDAVAPELPSYIPVAPKTKAERIAEKLASVNATDEWQLYGAAAGILALYIARGLTEEDAKIAAYAGSPLYHKAKDVLDEIEAIRAEP